MLRRIEGRGHSVFSGIAAALISGGEVVKAVSAVEETVVRFSPMTEADIDFYVNNEQVYDKAGAYAIQGIASAFIEKIDGDYFNVVGLPTCRMFGLFKDSFGIEPKDIICKVNK
jgi:septum formation protein